jgi:hypothetical protein
VIPLDRSIEIWDSDADMVDRCHEGTCKRWTCLYVLGAHNVTVTLRQMFAECVMGHISEYPFLGGNK